ncbi:MULTISPECIES: hypothetical protein [unclassified Mesorhizobium]|uniref:hypothetical protein n=1 Tax=unclassified Mesorhizobium TaxID=325217 RepID=UPI0016721329|nr:MULTISPECIES: hypothetical protein [unclassified Mesorhizobium]
MAAQHHVAASQLSEALKKIVRDGSGLRSVCQWYGQHREDTDRAFEASDDVRQV